MNRPPPPDVPPSPLADSDAPGDRAGERGLEPAAEPRAERNAAERGERAVERPVERPPEPRRADRPRRPTTPIRILHAAARQIVIAGVSNLSMQDVADEAGVSKGLIHYHFHDKETLLARLIEYVTRESIARERSALQGSTPRTAIDDLWLWLDAELERGHMRILTELTQERGPLVREAIREAATARREAATATVVRLFAILELRPRVPDAYLADVLVAFVDGLAINASLDPEANHRVVFDVFWLSMLSLAE